MISGLKISVLSIWMRGWGLQGLSHQGHSVGLLDKNFHPENTFLPFCKRMGTDRLLPKAKLTEILQGGVGGGISDILASHLKGVLILQKPGFDKHFFR